MVPEVRKANTEHWGEVPSKRRRSIEFGFCAARRFGVTVFVTLRGPDWVVTRLLAWSTRS